MKAELAKAWLSSQGYRYDVDSDGDIHFKYQGKNMYCRVDDKDELFFNLIMPNIYTVEGNRARVVEACNAIARDIKVVKAFLIDDHLWLAIEMFIDTTPELGDFFERCCNLLVAAFDRAAKEIL